VAFEFVKKEDVSMFMQAADLVVLPYRSIFNSGSALLALSFNKPVLLPDLGAMGELKNDFGNSWVQTFTGNLDAKTLEHSLEWATQSRPPVCAISLS
jgi:beta-1,4-mannosyltransferase